MALFNGQPKGLETVGLDRVSQVTEEMRRLKGEMAQLIRDFDTIVLKSASTINLGKP
jgi:hypothetical protein